MEVRISHIEKTLDRLEVELSHTVQYKHFVWTLGVLMTIITALFAYISNQMDRLQDTATATSQTVSEIQGKLEPYNIEYKN